MCYGRCSSLSFHLGQVGRVFHSVPVDGTLGWTFLDVAGIFKVDNVRSLVTKVAMSSKPHDRLLAQTCWRNTLLK